MMKAVQYKKCGPPEVLEVVTIPIPKRKKGEVLVKVYAAGLNPVDYKLRSGKGLPQFLLGMPKICGADLAGTIEDCDKGLFLKGDKVFAVIDCFSCPDIGTYAEYVLVPEKQLVMIPEGFSMEEAAGVPLAATTAWLALEKGGVNATSHVLIQAGAGGVGSFAIQLAKARGARVVTTCSTRNVEFCKSIGADDVVDYTQNKFWEQYKDRPFDVVIDVLGGVTETNCYKVIRRGGTFVPILGGETSHPKLVFWNICSLFGIAPGRFRYRMVFILPFAKTGPWLKSIAEVMVSGKLRVNIDTVFPLEHAVEAHKKLELGRTRGKIILKVRDEPAE